MMQRIRTLRGATLNLAKPLWGSRDMWLSGRGWRLYSGLLILPGLQDALNLLWKVAKRYRL